MIAVLLCIAVAAAWLAAAAFVRTRDALSRIHVVGFVNIVTGGALTVAAALFDGLSGRSLKVALIWLVALATNALLSHVTARALHLRGGMK